VNSTNKTKKKGGKGVCKQKRGSPCGEGRATNRPFRRKKVVQGPSPGCLTMGGKEETILRKTERKKMVHPDDRHIEKIVKEKEILVGEKRRRGRVCCEESSSEGEWKRTSLKVRTKDTT